VPLFLLMIRYSIRCECPMPAETISHSSFLVPVDPLCFV
jgi:hypothetical protein